MPIDFSKHKKGDVVRVHCCDSCARAAGIQPKCPPDSGSRSWPCEVCGHWGIGSATDCTIGDWLILHPNKRLTAETSNARGDVVAERQAWYEQQIALAEGQWAAAFLDRWECGDDVPSKEHYVALWLAERAAPQPADAEPKTLPVPTRVYLTDKAAVIVGDPQRGWDEEGPEAHNCDDMWCSTIGPHVLARVPFTDERSLAAAPQQGLRIVEPIRNCATPESREAAMVVLETDAEGNPTIWCDPEIADLVRALNVGGLRTVASCSGHGEKPFGIVTLRDGRELLVLPDFETTRIAERALGVTLAQQPAAVDGMAELVGLLDEVRSHFTRDDDLPDDLLPRIDAALATQRQEPKS